MTIIYDLTKTPHQHAQFCFKSRWHVLLKNDLNTDLDLQKN